MHMGKEEFPKHDCFNVYAQGDLGSLLVKKGAFNQMWPNDLFALLKGDERAHLSESPQHQSTGDLPHSLPSRKSPIWPNSR